MQGRGCTAVNAITRKSFVCCRASSSWRCRRGAALWCRQNAPPVTSHRPTASRRGSWRTCRGGPQFSCSCREISRDETATHVAHVISAETMTSRNKAGFSDRADHSSVGWKERKKEVYLCITQESLIAQSTDIWSWHVQHNKFASKQQIANSITIRVCKSDLVKGACEIWGHSNR